MLSYSEMTHKFDLVDTVSLLSLAPSMHRDVYGNSCEQSARLDYLVEYAWTPS